MKTCTVKYAHIQLTAIRHWKGQTSVGPLDAGLWAECRRSPSHKACAAMPETRHRHWPAPGSPWREKKAHGEEASLPMQVPFSKMDWRNRIAATARTWPQPSRKE